MHASRGRHNSAWGQVYGVNVQVKAHVPVQAKAEQAEVGAYGQEEVKGHSGKVGVGKFAWVTAGRGMGGQGVNTNSREKGMRKKKKEGYTYAPNYIPVAKFILWSFRWTLFNPEGKGGTG
ncbi:hypothetical protein BJV74DRAFT_800055 [Russula compacta]|nr:hypothetical protein BJV74DRAFT_800055 [Russula compacta]